MFIYVDQNGLGAKDDHMANGKGTQVGTASREEAGKGWHGNKDSDMVQGEKNTPSPSHLQGTQGVKSMGPSSC